MRLVDINLVILGDSDIWTPRVPKPIRHWETLVWCSLWNILVIQDHLGTASGNLMKGETSTVKPWTQDSSMFLFSQSGWTSYIDEGAMGTSRRFAGKFVGVLSRNRWDVLTYVWIWKHVVMQFVGIFFSEATSRECVFWNSWGLALQMAHVPTWMIYCHHLISTVKNQHESFCIYGVKQCCTSTSLFQVQSLGW